MDDADVMFVQMEDPFANVKVENSINTLTSDLMVDNIKIEPEIIINVSDKPANRSRIKVKREKDIKSKTPLPPPPPAKKEKLKEKKSKDIVKPLAAATINVVEVTEKRDKETPNPVEPVKQKGKEKKDKEHSDIKKEIIIKNERNDKEMVKLPSVKEEIFNDEEMQMGNDLLSPMFPQKMDFDSSNEADNFTNDFDDDNIHECKSEDEYETVVKKVRKRRRRRKDFNKSPNEELKCCFCNEIFPQLSQLKKHSAINHNDEQKYECDICGKIFLQRLFIERHMVNHTVKKPYCKYCGKTFYSLFTLKRHMSSHDSPMLFQCEVCHKIFENAFKLKKHMKGHNTPRTYPCDICQKPFQSAYLMKFHRVIHSGKKEFKCDVCGKCFTQLPTLHRHKFLHISDSEKNFFCEVCAKKFPAAYLLKAHMLVHRPPSNCPHCEKSFLLPSGLKIHIKAVHSGDNPYKCKICFKVFTQSSTMFRHMNLHNRSNEYTCDDCGKVFNVFYYLRKHIANVHSKAFSCELCNKSFTKPHKLANHMARSHTFKPHLRISRKDIRECYICARGFNYNGLSRHVVRCKRNMLTDDGSKQSTADIKMENAVSEDPNQFILGCQPPIPIDFTTDIKPKVTNKYKCSICDITVSQSSTLTRHMKIHTRDIFKCDLCGTQFNRSEHLEKHHQDVHNPNKPYKCEICKRTFSHMPTLETHASIHSLQS